MKEKRRKRERWGEKEKEGGVGKPNQSTYPSKLSDVDELERMWFGQGEGDFWGACEGGRGKMERVESGVRLLRWGYGRGWNLWWREGVVVVGELWGVEVDGVVVFVVVFGVV